MSGLVYDDLGQRIVLDPISRLHQLLICLCRFSISLCESSSFFQSTYTIYLNRDETLVSIKTSF